MRYDLNFWPALDWRRESSLDPRFLAAVVVCLVILVVLAAWSLSYVSLQASKTELARVTAANEKITEDALEVIRQDECIRYWQGIIEKTELKKKARMPWSRQLAAFAAVAPETVIFDGINVNSAPVRIELAEPVSAVKSSDESARKKKQPAKPKTVMRLQYDLTLTAVAVGENADETISRFSREIPLHPELSSWIESVELTSVQPKADAYGKMPGKKFSLVCRYKQLDWYDDPGQKRN